jgi:hypothetical protein
MPTIYDVLSNQYLKDQLPGDIKNIPLDSYCAHLIATVLTTATVLVNQTPDITESHPTILNTAIKQSQIIWSA